MAVNHTTSSDAVISLNQVIKTFRIRESWFRTCPFNAVDGVDLQIQAGELFGLLGKNGAGKTTLIKIMAGLLQADGGSGRVLGHDIYRDHKQIRASVSLVAPTADVGTDNNLTVRQNLEFWAVVYDLEPHLRARRIDELLEFLDLKRYEGHWPMSISAGQRQRLAIARSLLVNNPILFLDEPTVKLDAQGAQAVRALVKRINAEYGITVLLTTHLIFEAEELCDRVAIMDQGRIVSCDTVANLRKHLQQYDSCTLTCGGVSPALRAQIATQLGAHPGVVACTFEEDTLRISAEHLERVLYDALKLIRAHGIDVYAITSNEPTLEDVFLNAVEAQPETVQQSRGEA
jgi:ABC-2 type transport system ATP-binding protein